MDTIKYLLSPERPLGHVEDDEIFHTGVFDNLDGMPDMVIDWTLCFNDVLDAEKLHNSLCRLLQTGDWKKLSGRLRVGRGRTYEIHVPTKFTAERPLVDFSIETLHISIDEHPLAGKLPKPTPGELSFHESSRSFAKLGTPPGRPTTIKEFTMKDVPLIGLHIKSFTDATLVSLHYSHIMMDGPGQGELLRAWSRVLAGEQPPPLLGVHEDLVYKAADLDTGPQESYSLEPSLMTGLQMVLFVLFVLWDALWFSMDTRTVFLPKKTIDALRSNMVWELTEKQSGREEKPWVSDNDALQGLFGSRVAQTASSPRSLAMRTVFDLRGRVLGQAGGVFVQNAVMAAMTLLSAEEAQKVSASQLALQGRQALKEQTSPGQARAILRMFRRQWDLAKVGTALVGIPSQQLFMVSSWSRANIMQAAQFGPAVLKKGNSDTGRRNLLGTMWYQHWNIVKPSIFVRNVLLVYGRDNERNYWLTGYFKIQTWDAVEKALKDLA